MNRCSASLAASPAAKATGHAAESPRDAGRSADSAIRARPRRAASGGGPAGWPGAPRPRRSASASRSSARPAAPGARRRGRRAQLPLAGRAEARDREPDEPHRLDEPHALEQAAGLLVDARGRPAWARRCGARVKRREVGEAELERHHAPRVALRAAARAPPARPGLAQGRAQALDVAVIAAERLLGAHGLGRRRRARRGGRRGRARDPRGARPVAAEAGLERRRGPGARAGRWSGCPGPRARPRSRGPRPRAATPAAGRGTPPRVPALHHHEPVGLLEIGGDLGQELVGGHPHGRGEGAPPRGCAP